MSLRPILIAAFVFVTGLASGQEPLKTALSVSFHQDSAVQALLKVSRQSSVQFSFNPDVLPDRVITSRYDHQPLKEILDDILGPGYQYKVRGSYVIILPVTTVRSDTRVRISGEVRDANTGEKLANTSVYQVNDLSSTLTSSDGSFALNSRSYGNATFFAISKENYQDTVIKTDSTFEKALDIPLKPLQNAAVQAGRSADSTSLVKWLTGRKLSVHLRNVFLSEKRPVQFSLIPAVGTNGFMSADVSNNVSVNLIGGYAYSLKGAEVAGAFNLERTTVKGFQAAGAFNFAGDTMMGFQVAGALNRNLGDASGVQVAGAFNFSKGGFNGTQVAGAYNQSKEMHGAQIAGAANVSLYASGGFQLSGAVNLSENHRGMQLSGAYNHVSDTLKGMQLGVINYAGILKGVQVGVINIARSGQKSVMIGLLNFNKEGILALEGSYNDVTDFNLDFRSGTGQLYTILTGGISFRKRLWSTGAGLGHRFNLSERLHANIELSSHQLFATDQWLESQPWNHRLHTSLGYSFTKNIAVSGGPVLHFLHFDPDAEDVLRLAGEIGPSPFFEKKGTIFQKGWIGYRFAISI